MGDMDQQKMVFERGQPSLNTGAHTNESGISPGDLTALSIFRLLPTESILIAVGC